MEIVAHSGPWTEDDLPDGDRLVELLEGTLIVNAPPSGLHQVIARHLVNTITAPKGYVAVEAIGVRIPGGSLLIPDVAVIRLDQVSATMGTFDPAHVALVAEVVSPSSQVMDREVKPRLYAQAGIHEFWLVEMGDRLEDTMVHVHTLAVGSYRRETFFRLIDRL
jgi:Uma2 family endonuclease